MSISNPDENERLGLVIASTPFRESDLILEILFEGTGKHSVIARGARKSKKRFFGGIEIFEIGRFLVSRSRHRNILQLDGISQRIYLGGLRENLFSFQAASLLIETASKLIPEDEPEAARLFPVFFKVLKAVSNSSDKLQCMALLCYGILETCKYSGIDPVAEQDVFRPDQKEWFALMLQKKDIRIFEPLSTSVDTLETLVQFIQNVMDVRIKCRVPGHGLRQN
jgi:recombinational DNA repair protein (RecF pathway)